MQMVAADWLKSDKREDDLGGRPGGIVQVFLKNKYVVTLFFCFLCDRIRFWFLQKYSAHGGSEFFFIVHIQVSG